MKTLVLILGLLPFLLGMVLLIFAVILTLPFVWAVGSDKVVKSILNYGDDL